jgi:putative flippase GtrA
MPQGRAVHVARVKQVGKFGIVGMVNTALDFLLYNVLHFAFGLGLIQANIISTTVAMICSFFMNKRLVFRHQHKIAVRQAIIFFATTAFGLYVLQTGVIALLTAIWPQPLEVMVAAVHLSGLHQLLSDTFVINNGAKAAATVVSMAWNFIIYKKVVFKS